MAQHGENLAWQSEDTRKAVLSAARRIADRDGVAGVSLSRVAEEARFPAAAVAAIFPNKNDLLVAVVADDLTAFARLMHAAPAQLPTTPAQESGPPARPRLLRRVPATPGTQSERAVGDTSQVVPEPVEGVSAQAMAALPMEDRVAKLEARPIDAWLERRLRVFERSLADLQTRQEKVERNSAASSELLENTVVTVKETVGQCEKRQHETLSELRNLVLDVSSRLESFEGGSPQASPVEPVFIEQPQPAVDPPQPFASVGGARAEPCLDTAESPLTAARRAAQAAALLSVNRGNVLSRLAAKVAPKAVSSGKSNRRKRETQYIIAGCTMLVMLLATAAFLLSQTAHGMEASAAPSYRGLQPVPDGIAHARRVYASAEDMGRSELLVGLEYLEGRGKPRNATEAARWLERAADAGEAVAQVELATLYRRGDGVVADPAQALHWYEAAALQGNRKAMYDLANAYAQGWGTAKDFSEAARWFSRAAELGLVDSAFNLGVMFERGQGVPQSLRDAYKWYAIAAAKGDGESKTRIDVLRTQLNASDLAAAEQAADAFTPAEFDPSANEAPALPSTRT